MGTFEKHPNEHFGKVWFISAKSFHRSIKCNNLTDNGQTMMMHTKWWLTTTDYRSLAKQKKNFLGKLKKNPHQWKIKLKINKTTKDWITPMSTWANKSVTSWDYWTARFLPCMAFTVDNNYITSLLLFYLCIVVSIILFMHCGVYHYFIYALWCLSLFYLCIGINRIMMDTTMHK
jgi:hypothetical protein